MNKRVEGVYTNVEDALRAVNRLSDQGYGRNAIYVVANDTVKQTIPFTLDAEVITEEQVSGQADDSHQSLWDRMKDAFTFDNDDRSQEATSSSDSVTEYHEDVEQGKIVVLVDNDAVPATNQASEVGEITTPADPAINDGRIGSTEEAFGTGTSGGDTSERMKSMMEKHNSIAHQEMRDADLTHPHDTQIDGPVHLESKDTKQTVNDVNVPLHEELDLAEDERTNK